MHPANAAILNTALAPYWQLLRDWLSAALHNHQHSRNHLTRDELAPIRTSIFEIEALLRRLVLVAATAITLDTAARWSPAPKTDATTRARHTPKAIVRKAIGFRLFKIVWSKTGAKLATTAVLIDRSAAQSTPRTSAHSDTLTSGPPGARPAAPPKSGDSPHTHHTHIAKKPIELTAEEFDRWGATLDLAAARAEAEAEYRAAMEELELADQPRPQQAPKQAAQPRLEKKTVPQLLDATELQARLALLEELVANPEALIQRAAHAMNRRREIAYRLSLVPAPKARGHLAMSANVLGTLIPFHAGYSQALCYFALSWTEPDTT